MTNFSRGGYVGKGDPFFTNFDLFFFVYHQFTGVTNKNGELCTSGPLRSKIGQICQKIFFENFAHFLQNNETTRILMLGLILGIFAKMTNFSREDPLGKMTHFSSIFNLFFGWLPSISRGNGQKWGAVHELPPEGENGSILTKTFFREFCTLFAK